MKRCCTGDGGRPSAIALQEEVANHPEVRRSRAVRAERRGKRRAIERVRYGPMKANASKPPLTCRNVSDGVKTRSGGVDLGGAWGAPAYCPGGVRHGGGASAGQAPVWNMGTCRLAGERLMAPGLQSPLPGTAPSARNREERSPEARHRDGPPGSSDEGPVIGLERSGRAIQAKLTVNHAACGRSR